MINKKWCFHFYIFKVNTIKKVEFILNFLFKLMCALSKLFHFFIYVVVHLKVNYHLTINQVAAVTTIVVVIVIVQVVEVIQSISLQEVKNDAMMIVMVIATLQKNISKYIVLYNKNLEIDSNLMFFP